MKHADVLAEKLLPAIYNKERGETDVMEAYRFKVIRRGTIIADGVAGMKEAEGYIGKCSPDRDVRWQDTFETDGKGTRLKRITLPEPLNIRDFSALTGISPSVTARWLYLNGRTVRDFNLKLTFREMREIAEEHGFFCEKKPECRWSRNGRHADGKDAIRGRINEEIRKRNIPKTEIAERCGFDRKILYGGFCMSLPYFARLCEVLHVSAEYLLFGDGSGGDETGE